jgi:hypothetical protein
MSSIDDAIQSLTDVLHDDDVSLTEDEEFEIHSVIGILADL